MEKENKPADDKLPKQLEEPTKRIIQNEGYTSYDMKCRNLSTDGGSFIGVLYEIDLTELQDDAGIADDERFQMAKHFDECNASSIILENLVKRGFKTYYRMDVVTLKYAEFSVKHLAKFHALSFVIQMKRPDYFKKNIELMNQPFVFGDDWHRLIRNMYRYSINCLEPEVKAKVGETILRKIDDYGRYMSDTSGVRTLCHGDYKHNNIMAKEVNGTLTEVLAIDYQLLHCGKPILDFLYLIFNGTDQEFRRKHLNHLKHTYYDTMKMFLAQFALDIESVFPQEEFEREFKEKLDFGLMINVFYVPFLFVCEEDAPDVVNQPLDTLAFKVDKRFTERFRGVVDDFMQWGYI